MEVLLITPLKHGWTDRSWQQEKSGREGCRSGGGGRMRWNEEENGKLDISQPYWLQLETMGCRMQYPQT